MGPHHPGSWVLGADPVPHHPRPQPARRPQFADFLEEIVLDVPEEGNPRCHEIRRQAALHGLGHVAMSRGEREGELLHRVGTCIANVIAGDAHRIVARHRLGRVLHRVDHQAHGLGRRIDVLVLGCVLFQDVVLTGAGDLFLRHAVLLAHRFVHADQHERRGVDRVRGRHLVQGNIRHQQADIVDRVHGHADLADFRDRDRVIGVVAEQRRQVEVRRQSRLAVGQQVLVSPVGVFGRTEPRDLSERPRTGPMHRRVHAAGVRVLTGKPDHLGGIAGADVGGRIEVVNRQTRERRERFLALGQPFETWSEGSPSPAFGIGRCLTLRFRLGRFGHVTLLIDSAVRGITSLGKDKVAKQVGRIKCY